MPIIFITAINKASEHVRLGYSLGAVDYVFKPFEAEILRSKVNVFLELFRNRESVRRQVQIPLDDDVSTLFVTLTAMHDEAGESLGSVVVFDDYTQLVKVQRMAAWRRGRVKPCGSSDSKRSTRSP